MNLQEIEMIESCCRGERKAQLRLYSMYSRQMYNSCYRILQNQMDAEDAMQESFLKAFAKLDQYNQDVPLGAWINRIAINTSIDRLRQKKADLIEINENINYDLIYNYPEDDDWETTTEMVTVIKKAITELPDHLRIIITLYLIEGYDHEEIAEILKIKVGTSRVQYMRAKQKILELLKNRNNEEFKK